MDVLTFPAADKPLWRPTTWGVSTTVESWYNLGALWKPLAMPSEKSAGNHMMTFISFLDILLPCNAASCKTMNLGGLEGGIELLIGFALPSWRFLLRSMLRTRAISLRWSLFSSSPVSSCVLSSSRGSPAPCSLFSIRNGHVSFSIGDSSLSILYSGEAWSSEETAARHASRRSKCSWGWRVAWTAEARSLTISLGASTKLVTNFVRAPKSTWALAVSGLAGSMNVSYSIGRWLETISKKVLTILVTLVGKGLQHEHVRAYLPGFHQDCCCKGTQVDTGMFEMPSSWLIRENRAPGSLEVKISVEAIHRMAHTRLFLHFCRNQLCSVQYTCLQRFMYCVWEILTVQPFIWYRGWSCSGPCNDIPPKLLISEKWDNYRRYT